jgi:hypothetical protein
MVKYKDLSLRILLYTHETHLKYIDRIHSYLRHTSLMFNTTNIDKVLVQDTHLQASKGKNASEYYNPFKFQKKPKAK